MLSYDALVQEHHINHGRGITDPKDARFLYLIEVDRSSKKVKFLLNESDMAQARPDRVKGFTVSSLAISHSTDNRCSTFRMHRRHRSTRTCIRGRA